jgi:formate dehydrogenase major subunit
LVAAFGLAGGTGSFDDLDRADCILLVGANPTEAHPVVGARLKQLIRHGARLVVIDPRRTELAEIADVQVAGRPGSNVAVSHGIAHLLVAGGYVDEAFIQARVSGYDELLRALGDYDPDRVGRIAAASADDLRSAATLFGAAKRPAIVYGLGVTERAHGTDASAHCRTWPSCAERWAPHPDAASCRFAARTTSRGPPTWARLQTCSPAING